MPFHYHVIVTPLGRITLPSLITCSTLIEHGNARLNWRATMRIVTPQPQHSSLADGSAVQRRFTCAHLNVKHVPTNCSSPYCSTRKQALPSTMLQNSFIPFLIHSPPSLNSFSHVFYTCSSIPCLLSIPTFLPSIFLSLVAVASLLLNVTIFQFNSGFIVTTPHCQ